MDAKKLMVLVNRQFARQYPPNGNLIGRRLINSMAQFEIIGVTGDVRGTAVQLPNWLDERYVFWQMVRLLLGEPSLCVRIWLRSL